MTKNQSGGPLHDVVLLWPVSEILTIPELPLKHKVRSPHLQFVIMFSTVFSLHFIHLKVSKNLRYGFRK
jgi:hypothetical protein